MAFDTRPNLSSEKFEQFSGETLNLSGITRSYGAFEYGIDNSENYHERSIPDVAWVMSLFNSLSGNTGNFWKNGGTTNLTGLTTIDSGSNPIVLKTATSPNYSLIQFNQHQLIAASTNGSGIINGLIANSSSTSLRHTDPTTTFNSRIEITPLQMLVVDGVNESGLKYENDYTISGTSRYGNLWIPHKGYVDAAIASAVSGVTGGSGSINVGNGLSLNNDVVVLGGTLTGNTTIDNSIHELDFIGRTSFNFKNISDSSRFDFLSTTLNGITDVSLLSFRSDSGRTVSDGYSDIWLGANNGNSGTTSPGGNIGIGNNNLISINPSGTFFTDPWYQTFQGDRNIAIGFNNGKSLTGGAGNAASGNILMGTRVMELTTQSSYNIFMGFHTARNFSIPLSSTNGQSNVGIGNYLMQDVTGGTAAYNVLFGTSVAGSSKNVGSSNVGVGNFAFQNVDTIGNSNVAVGASTFNLSGNLGDHNIAVGSHAFRETVAGMAQNTAVGVEAGVFAGGFSNTYLGAFAGFGVRGQYNTSIGALSGWVVGNDIVADTMGPVYTGNRSIFIGYQTGYDESTPSANDVVVIGTSYRPTLESGNIYFGALKEIIFETDINGISTNVFTIHSGGTSTFGGIVNYDDDKSSGFTKHSIVDVNYVTGITSTISANVDNGLSKDNGTIVLGGNLVTDTSITATGSTHDSTISFGNSAFNAAFGVTTEYNDGFTMGSASLEVKHFNGTTLAFDDLNGEYNQFRVGASGIEATSNGNNFSKYAYFDVSNSNQYGKPDEQPQVFQQIVEEDGTVNDVLFSQYGFDVSMRNSDGDDLARFTITKTGTTFIDGRTGGTSAGIEYGGDYSTGFTKHSLVDVNYVTGITSQISNTLVVSNSGISGDVVVDLTTADVFLLTLTGNVTTFNFTGETVGKQYMFKFIMDTSNKSFSWATGRYRFPFGNAPALTNPTTNGSSPAHSEDIITAICMSNGRLDIAHTPDLREN